jgi:hypothetical protein
MNKPILGCWWLIALCLLTACMRQKISKGNRLLYVKDGGEQSNELHRYKVLKPFNAEISEQTGYLKINKTIGSLKDTVVEEGQPISLKGSEDVDKIGMVFFGDQKEPDLKKFEYSSGAFGLQALTIPLKVRPARSLKIDYPTSVETGVNLGFALGYKMTNNVFTTHKNLWGKNSVAYSLTPGALLGIGGTALKAAANAPGLPFDYTAPSFSYGGFVLFGINNISIGYAFGFDHVIGTGGKYWIYQDRLWHGVIISLDILKF